MMVVVKYEKTTKNKMDHCNARDQKLPLFRQHETISRPFDALNMIRRLWRTSLRSCYSGTRLGQHTPGHILNTRPSFATTRTYAAKSAEDLDEEELKAARSWLTTFTPESIPKSICEVSFSRSSGPGGQNVNK